MCEMLSYFSGGKFSHSLPPKTISGFSGNNIAKFIDNQITKNIDITGEIA